VFMDNVSVRWNRKTIEAGGAIPFYLPACSPDLNPIEQLFAKLKALLHNVAAYSLLSPSGAYARPSPPVSIKSPELNAPRISHIQDMVNLDGER
jgi:hypothetical protein